MCAAGSGLGAGFVVVRAREEKLTAVSLRPWSKVIQSLLQTLQFCGAASYWCRVCIIILLVEGERGHALLVRFSSNTRKIGFVRDSLQSCDLLRCMNNTAVLFVTAWSHCVFGQRGAEEQEHMPAGVPGVILNSRSWPQTGVNQYATWLQKKTKTVWLCYTSSAGHCISES